MVIGESAEVISLLNAIAKWTREAALPQAKLRVERLLDSDSKKRAYAAMTGGATLAAIERDTGANHNDVKKWLEIWELAGITQPGMNPPKATFTLLELGIEVPPPKAARGSRASR